MSVTSVEPEQLLARKIPWRKRLWVRATGILLLISIISFTSVWWPRRTMLSVWFANGIVCCDSRQQPTYDLMGSLGIMRTVWGTKNWEDHYALLSGIGLDRDVSVVWLLNSEVTDDWLFHLKHLPNLRSLSLHDKQLGTGLDALRDMPSLNHLSVMAASNRHLIYLQRVPNLEYLNLYSPSPGNLGLDMLSLLPKLKWLEIANCPHTDQILKSLPELPAMEEIVFRNCTGFADDDLAYLQHLPNLKYLHIVRCGPFNDDGLKQLCQLKALETLEIRQSSGHFTDEGLEALKELPKLKEIQTGQGDFTADQLKKLEELLPNVFIDFN